MANRVCLSCKTPFKPKSARSFYCTMKCRNHRFRINPDLFWEQRVTKMPSGCWEYNGYRQWFGHGSMGRMLEDGRRVYILAHRHAWELKNGPVPEGKWVLHHCDNPPCCNPDHLYLGVRADNVRDKIVRQRDKRWLTREQVLEIRAALDAATERGGIARVAKQFGIKDSVACQIKLRKKYAYYV